MTTPQSLKSSLIKPLVLTGVLAAFLATSSLAASELSREEHIRAHYAKAEYRIPMRDGAHLFTAVYTPVDAVLHAERQYPILLMRTPYSVGPYGADAYKGRLGPVEAFEKEKFIFVFQDVRRRSLSEATYDNMRPHGGAEVNESTDTYDTVEWLLDHLEGHNGRVGQWGNSYPGFYTSAGIIDGHPALVAASPQAPIADWFWDDMHRHGAFSLQLAFNFFSSFGQARPEPTVERAERFDLETPDAYGFFMELGPLSNANERHFDGEIAFWNAFVEHPNYDEFWQSRNILPHLRNIQAAVLTVGGWFDAEDLYGPLKTYASIEKQNPGISNRLVMGPWQHGGWFRTDGSSLGEISFGYPTAKTFQTEILLPFFLHHLKGEGESLDLPEAMIFETGANRWRSFDAWPPQGLEKRTLHLAADGNLQQAPPEGEADAYDAYPSDPHKPVPYTLEIASTWSKDYMTEDQRFAARRPDVLVYQTEPLEEDLTLAGPLEAQLFVSTTGSASDFIVKVIDVFPGEVPNPMEGAAKEDLGHYQMLVRGEAFRGRFRDSYEKPIPFVPGEVAEVSFELQDVLHTFKKGHRLMVQVQSSWFPLIDRNPQRYVENIFEAKEEDFISVTNRVHRSKEYPSALHIGILPRP